MGHFDLTNRYSDYFCILNNNKVAQPLVFLQLIDMLRNFK